jgi:hypothetical protein
MKNKFKILGVLLAPAIIFGWLLLGISQKAAAYNYTDYLMDDSVFRNAYAMSATDVLNFLQQKNSGLANFKDVFVCGYPTDAHFNFYNQHYNCNVAVNSPGGTYYQTQPQSAALIIAESAQAYGINPQVIIGTLQKEQSLITTPNPTSYQLNFAMGYACPDAGGCGGVSGFFNQVDNGTWQFRTDFELGLGYNWWGYTPASYPCNGATRYYSAALKPGNTVTFYDEGGAAYSTITIPNMSTATFYCYTPHVYYPGKYSGSYWFVYYFSQWFGSNVAPYAFKGASSSTIYFYINGTKVAVPAMGIIQDYGVNPAAIHTLDQSTVDSIPAPTDGSSASLNYLVKSPSDSDADGGSIYLVTVGKRYQFQTFSQFSSDYGLTGSNISYEPLSFIQSIPNGGSLSSFISSPYGSVFQMLGGQKHLIFDYATYIGLNPSDQLTPASYFAVNQSQSGNPLSNRDILVKYSSGEAVNLFLNGNYYGIPTLDAYNCWGFSAALNTPVFRLPDNSYVPAITPSYSLSCLVGNGTSSSLLSRNARYSLPSTYGISAPQTDNVDVQNLANRIPSTASPLKQYIKSNTSAAVWYLNGGSRSTVPTLANFNLLNLSGSDIDTIDSSALSSITAAGIKLGNGKAVKADNSDAVYMIQGNARAAYSSIDDFLAYRDNWSDIETYPAAVLDSYYPYTGTSVKKYLLDSSTNKTYLIDNVNCYYLTTSQLASYNNPASQPYASQRINVNNCRPASLYVKSTDSPAVYKISSGNKQAFTTWDALTRDSGTNNPYIITLTPSTMATFTTGSNLN